MMTLGDSQGHAQDDYMIPQTFTVTSEHIRFYFLVFCFTLFGVAR